METNKFCFISYHNDYSFNSVLSLQLKECVAESSAENHMDPHLKG